MATGELLSSQYQPVQIAYYVNDIEAAAARMAASTGAGPFFVIQDIQLDWCEHRGEPCNFIHSSAYGQLGELMLELVQQEDAGPSPFRDMYEAGTEGIHHTACFVDSIDDTLAHYQRLGFPLATRAKAALGTEFAFIDTRALLGHLLEIYVPTEALTDFYYLVREASIAWDGKDLLRRL